MAGKPGRGGGARPGAGRPKGVPNKASVKREAEIAASGLTPLEYMLQVMRDVTNEAHVRLDAGRSAAPYVHPKLSAIAVTNTTLADMSDDEINDLLAIIRTLKTGIR